jgi:hypothetical protein
MRSGEERSIEPDFRIHSGVRSFPRQALGEFAAGPNRDLGRRERDWNVPDGSAMTGHRGAILRAARQWPLTVMLEMQG